MTLKLDRPTPLEDRIVRLLLAGSLPPLVVLRRQWELARIAERTADEWGTTTLRIWVPIDSQLVVPYRQDFGDVVVRTVASGGWRACILEVERGVLHELQMPTEARVAEQAHPVDVSYSMLVQSPDDSDDMEVVPVPDRDWAELRDYYARIGTGVE